MSAAALTPLWRTVSHASCRTNPFPVTFSQKRFRYPPSEGYAPKLSVEQTSVMLRANEMCKEYRSTDSPIRSIEWNQLSSNNPIEDFFAIARTKWNNGYLFGIYDGHGGPSCGQVLANRLLSFAGTSLYGQPLSLQTAQNILDHVVPLVPLRQELESLHSFTFLNYLTSQIASSNDRENPEFVEQAMVNAFLEMDSILSEEALAFLLGSKLQRYLKTESRCDWKPWWRKSGKILKLATLSVAMSGAVACVAYVQGNKLTVANTGDCQAVLGQIGEDDNWVARKLSIEHTSENPHEINRLFSEHPRSEQDTILRMDRLLGQLMPLRAFGDFRFKWPREILEQWVVPIIGQGAVPSNYHTPPYLTARPEITHHTISSKDKFLVIGSDGLWDMLTPTQVVRLVGEHMSGRIALGPLTLPQGDVSLGYIGDMLKQRRDGLSKRPLDSNSATHLIRHALGSTDTGLDHNRLSEMLSLPDDAVRLFRDDITIIVVYFDSNYMSQRSR